MDAELDSQDGVGSYKPGFDAPSEHRHVMQGMTEQQHKVCSSTSAPTGHSLTHTKLVVRPWSRIHITACTASQLRQKEASQAFKAQDVLLLHD